MRRIVIGRFEGQDLRRPVAIYGRRGSLVCVEKFSPDHGWIIVELTV